MADQPTLEQLEAECLAFLDALRNIVGERVLGLPKDTGIDATTPFKDLLKN